MNNEDIKVLEEYKEKMIKDEKIHDDYRNMFTAIENLIAGYKELEKENKTLKGFTMSIFNDTLEKDYIPKSTLQEILEDIDNNQPIIAELKLRKLVEGDK